MKARDKQPPRWLAASTEDFSTGRDGLAPPQIKQPQPECRRGPFVRIKIPRKQSTVLVHRVRKTG